MKFQHRDDYICKIPFPKKFGSQISRWLKNYIPEICQNIEKVEYQGTECKNFFQIYKWGWGLVLINVNVGF